MTAARTLGDLAPLPTDTSKQYAYKPGTGWVEVVIPPAATVFTSTNQTITFGTTLTLPHGLGAEPKWLNLKIINVTTSLGYPVGRVVTLGTLQVHSSTTLGFYIWADATNVYVVTNTSGVYINAGAGIGGPTPITASAWNYIAEAKLTP